MLWSLEKISTPKHFAASAINAAIETVNSFESESEFDNKGTSTEDNWLFRIFMIYRDIF